MAKFKIGDRVRVANIDTDDAKSGARVGSTGRVLDNSVAPWVRMDHKIEIHGATTSLCEYGYGKVFAETQLEFESVTIDQIRDQLAKGYEAVENAKACFDKAKEMLDAKDAKPPRNWPERIEAGMCFEQANGSRYLVCGTKFVNLDTGALWLLGGGPSGNDKIDLSYLGKLATSSRSARTRTSRPGRSWWGGGSTALMCLVSFSLKGFVTNTTRTRLARTGSVGRGTSSSRGSPSDRADAGGDRRHRRVDPRISVSGALATISETSTGPRGSKAQIRTA